MSVSEHAHELDRGLEQGRQLLEGIVARDWDRVAATIAPEGRFLAVVANEEHPFREHIGPEAATQQIRRWFDDSDEVALIGGQVDAVADRVRINYRIRGHDPDDGWYLIEQLIHATPGTEGYTRMNLACSGFRPTDPGIAAH